MTESQQRPDLVARISVSSTGSKAGDGQRERPMSHTAYVLWLLAGALSQFLWGAYPACMQYLFTQQHPQPPPLQLVCTTLSIAAATLLLISALPQAVGAAYRWHRQRRQQAATLAAAAAAAAAATPADVEAAIEAVMPPSEQQQEQQPAAQKPAAPTLKAWCGYCLGGGALLVGMTLCFVSSARLVPAYLIALLTLLAPLVVSALRVVALRRPAPRYLVPAALATLGACALVVAGSWLAAPGTAGGSAASMAAGVALALTAMLCISGFLVVVEAARGVASGDAIRWTSFGLVIIFVLPAAIVTEGGIATWAAWTSGLTPLGVAVLIVGASCIYTFATVLMQSAAQAVGGSMVAVTFGTRLIGALAMQAALPPHAVPTEPLIVAGLVLVSVVITTYLGLQVLWARQDAAAAKAAAAGGGGGGPEAQGSSGSGAAAGAVPPNAAAPVAPAEV